MLGKIAWALAPVVLLVATADAGAEDAKVTVGHARLEPAVVTVAAGDTVTFHNVDAMPGGHTIVADDGSFESPGLAKDESWAHSFADPGEHPYHVKQHPMTRGKVIVE